MDRPGPAKAMNPYVRRQDPACMPKKAQLRSIAPSAPAAL